MNKISLSKDLKDMLVYKETFTNEFKNKSTGLYSLNSVNST